jgi:molybdopterin-guanine dinucleotide biosynthesis protein A
MKLSAVLLAGGESRRMGRDKATVVFRGQPLWCHQLAVLREVGPFELLISARKDPSWRPTDTIFVPDIPPSRGPLSGVAAAMAGMRGTHLFALAVDMPFITPLLINAMCRMTSLGSGTLPKIGHRSEPLAAIYPRESLTVLTSALGGQEFSMQHVTEKLVTDGLMSGFQVSRSDAQFYRSLNEPEDIEKFEGSPATY